MDLKTLSSLTERPSAGMTQPRSASCYLPTDTAPLLSRLLPVVRWNNQLCEQVTTKTTFNACDLLGCLIELTCRQAFGSVQNLEKLSYSFALMDSAVGNRRLEITAGRCERKGNNRLNGKKKHEHLPQRDPFWNSLYQTFRWFFCEHHKKNKQKKTQFTATEQIKRPSSFLSWVPSCRWDECFQLEHRPH